MTKNIRKYLKKFNTKCIIMASLRKGTKKMKQKLHKILKIDDLKDMLDKSGKIYGDKPAYKLKTKTPGEYKIITHKEARENSRISK